ncbi:hypothetical protein GCK32_006388 [Trichostrongylus colubriformis]|uniref:Uncharacterized protein n=1 Tax=Trichostrongylus colubriformis TaxID=6319 RepID=A0AAN8F9G1_TRICO
MAYIFITPKRLLTMYSNKLENVVSSFRSEKLELESLKVLNSLPTPPQKETQDFEEYSSKAEKSLFPAFEYSILL